MSLVGTFINNPENFEQSMEKIRNAGKPDNFGKNYLGKLGFDESKAILYARLFKLLELIDEDGNPLMDYDRFIQSKKDAQALIAEKVWSGYKKVFAIHKSAHTLEIKKMAAVFRKIHGNEMSYSFIILLCNTFKALADYADWQTDYKTESIKTVDTPDTPNTANQIEDEEEKPHSEEEINEELSIKSRPETSNETTGTETPNNKVESPEEEFEEDPPERPSDSESLSSIESDENINDHKKEAQFITIGKNREKKNLTSLPLEEDDMLPKALFKRADLLQKLNRSEEAINALDQIVSYFDRADVKDKGSIVSKTLMRKAEILEEIGEIELSLEAYEEYISRFQKPDDSDPSLRNNRMNGHAS